MPSPQPTSALPGTEEKVRVMRMRARHGQPLCHPDDARLSERAAFIPRSKTNSARHAYRDVLVNEGAEGPVAVKGQTPRPPQGRSRTPREKERQAANRPQEAWRKRLERGTSTYQDYRDWKAVACIMPPVPQPSPWSNPMAQQILDRVSSVIGQRVAALQEQMRALTLIPDILREAMATDEAQAPLPSNGNGAPPAPKKAAKENAPAGRLQIRKDTQAGRVAALLIEHGRMKSKLIAELLGDGSSQMGLNSVLYKRKDLFTADNGTFSLATQEFDLVD